MNDAQINPIYYHGSKDGHDIQLWDVYDAFGLTPMEANIIKYVVRSRRKKDCLLDLEKAHRCLARLISNEKKRIDILNSIPPENVRLEATFNALDKEANELQAPPDDE
jgi:hypothetical protein